MSHLHSFRTLLNACSRFSQALPPVQLNGYLSAIAAGPELLEEQAWQEQLLGTGSDSAEVRELAEECVQAIRDDIRNEEYEPYLVEGRFGKPQVGAWMQGFNQAVDLDEPTWREYNDTYLDAGKAFVYLASLVNPGIAEIFGIKPSQHKKFVKENSDSIGLAVTDLYRGYREIDDETCTPLPEHSAEELREYSDDALIDLLSEEGDQLTRTVVDECLRRQASLLPRLRELLEEPAYYTDEYTDFPEWWVPVHAIHILGAMEGEGAAGLLLDVMEAMHHYPGSDTWEPLSPYWAALFRNKREHAAAALQRMAEDRGLRWQPRLHAWECLLEAAAAQGPAALDRVLAEAAEIVGDPSEEYLLRMLLGQHLLDHPREAHRALLEQLAEQQEESGTLDLFFLPDDVAEAYEKGEDQPEWRDHMDLLERYDPRVIRARQLKDRTSELLEEDEWEFQEDELFPNPGGYEPPETYVRPTPKTGRNDPCPCGSGKKYKKCCGR